MDGCVCDNDFIFVHSIVKRTGRICMNNIENEFHFTWKGSRAQRKESARLQIAVLCVAKKVGFYNSETNPTRTEVSAKIKELRKELIS